MKAAFLPGYRQDYVVETTADPEPPGPGEIIVKVGAAGVLPHGPAYLAR